MQIYLSCNQTRDFIFCPVAGPASVFSISCMAEVLKPDDRLTVPTVKNLPRLLNLSGSSKTSRSILAAGQLRSRKIYENSQENVSNSCNRKEIHATSESQNYYPATPYCITRVPPATTLFNRPFNRLLRIQLSSLQQTGKCTDNGAILWVEQLLGTKGETTHW